VRAVGKWYKFVGMLFVHIDYKLITNLMHWLLFVHKYYPPLHVWSIKCSSSGGHSCIQAAYVTVTLYKSPGDLLIRRYRENYVLLKMSTWCSKHVEESNILPINNSQCIKLVINVSQFMMHGQKNIKFCVHIFREPCWSANFHRTTSNQPWDGRCC